MKDILSQVTALKRPEILVRAARFGLDDYMRETHLKRCLKIEKILSPGQALLALLEIEKQLNSDRSTNKGRYDVSRHVEVMIAIMGEARIFRAMHRPALV